MIHIKNDEINKFSFIFFVNDYAQEKQWFLHCPIMYSLSNLHDNTQYKVSYDFFRVTGIIGILVRLECIKHKLCSF